MPCILGRHGWPWGHLGNVDTAVTVLPRGKVSSGCIEEPFNCCSSLQTAGAGHFKYSDWDLGNDAETDGRESHTVVNNTL